MINTDTEIRYVIKLEAHASVDSPGVCELDEDQDYINELKDIVENLHESGEITCPEEIFHKNKFDLCETCYREYLRDPLGNQSRMRIDFSSN